MRAATSPSASSLLPPPTASDEMQLSLNAQESADGAQLLAQSGCAVCHGAEGQGTAAGPSLDASALSLDEFVASVRQATRTMPAYAAEVLPDEDLTRMFAFLEAQTAEPAPAGRAGRCRSGTLFGLRLLFLPCRRSPGRPARTAARTGPDHVRAILLVHAPSDANDAAVFGGRADGSGDGRHLRFRRGATAAAACWRASRCLRRSGARAAQPSYSSTFSPAFQSVTYMTPSGLT